MANCVSAFKCVAWYSVHAEYGGGDTRESSQRFEFLFVLLAPIE